MSQAEGFGKSTYCRASAFSSLLRFIAKLRRPAGPVPRFLLSGAQYHPMRRIIPPALLSPPFILVEAGIIVSGYIRGTDRDKSYAHGVRVLDLAVFDAPFGGEVRQAARRTEPRIDRSILQPR
jgi:hypothetical protein